MKKYELLLTLPGTLDDNEVKIELNTITEVLKGFVEDLQTKHLGKIRLAYPIKQIRYGYYYTIVFEAEPRQIPEITKKLGLNKLPLRAIINIYNPDAKDLELAINNQQAAQTVVKEKVSLEDVMADVVEKKEEETVVDKKEEKKDEKPIDLNDIDKKLDEILDSTGLASDI